MVPDAPLGKHTAQLLGVADADRAHKHGAHAVSAREHITAHSLQLLRLRAKHHILPVDSLHRSVGGDLHNVHPVYLRELLLLGAAGTGHAGFLFVFIEKALIRDGGDGPVLRPDPDPLLGLDSLVQSLGIAPPRHDAPRQRVHYQHFPVLDHIVPVAHHQIVRLQSQIHMVLKLKIFEQCDIFNTEKALRPAHTRFRKEHLLRLLVNDEVAGLLLLHTGNRIQL